MEPIKGSFITLIKYMGMTLTSILIYLIVGAVAGWLAGNIMRGGGFGLLWNMLLGILGSFVGSWLFGTLGIAFGSGLLSTLIVSVIGAVVVLFIAGLFRR